MQISDLVQTTAPELKLAMFTTSDLETVPLILASRIQCFITVTCLLLSPKFIECFTMMESLLQVNPTEGTLRCGGYTAH
jgi:hypothetical protein